MPTPIIEDFSRVDAARGIVYPQRLQTPGSASIVASGPQAAQLFAEDGLASVSVSLGRAALVDLMQSALEILRRMER